MSTYPDRCSLKLERRTIPGETAETALAEIQGACERLRRRRPTFDAAVALLVAQGPSDVSTEAPLVRSLRDSLEAAGESVRIEGMSAWTDCALLNEAGIPAICFGPGDIGLAHAAEEFVPMEEIVRATDVLARLALDWCATGSQVRATAV
jgi:acetylornithine deacetylase